MSGVQVNLFENLTIAEKEKVSMVVPNIDEDSSLSKILDLISSSSMIDSVELPQTLTELNLTVNRLSMLDLAYTKTSPIPMKLQQTLDLC